MKKRDFMLRAIEVSKQSPKEEGREDPTPLVGAILVKNGKEIASCFRGQTGIGDHAEFGLLKKIDDLKDKDLSGSTLYVTLEPCTIRSSKKTPCVIHIVEKGITEVVIGILDPNRKIQGDGYFFLQEKGIKVSFFDSDLSKEIFKINSDFMDYYRPNSWLPPKEIRSLDDWYHIINGIYLSKNYKLSEMDIFSHLVEVIAGLSFLSTEKTKKGITVELYIPKILAWWFALCGKVGIRSVEDILWIKFPGVCSYCHQQPHKEKLCKNSKKGSPHPNWEELIKISKDNIENRPQNINEWRQLFCEIYPVASTEKYDMVLGRLLEELGELSECLRVKDLLPNSLLSEIADVFAWLMHLTSLFEVKNDIDINLSNLLFNRYPDRCKDCDSSPCVCPPIINSSLHRISHEGPPLTIEGYSSFLLSPMELYNHFSIGSSQIFINGEKITVNDDFIKETYVFSTELRHELMQNSEINEKNKNQLLKWCNSMSNLIAKKQISQQLIEDLIEQIKRMPNEKRNLSHVFSKLSQDSSLCFQLLNLIKMQ